MAKRLLNIFGTLVLLGGSAAAVGLFLQPASPGAVFPTLTRSYQAAAGAALGLLLSGIGAGLGLLLFTHRKPEKVQQASDRIAGWLNGEKRLEQSSLVLLAVSAVLLQWITQRAWAPVALQVRFLGLVQPILAWGVGLALGTLFLLWGLAGRWTLEKDPGIRRFLGLAGVVLLLALGLGASPYGYQRTSELMGNFRPTGYPVLGYQVGFCLLAVLLYLGFERLLPEDAPAWIRDAVLITAVAGGAFVLWSTAPVEPNGFIDQPRPPNQEIYPALDAVIYDRSALSLLVRGKFQSYLTREGHILQDVIRRPALALYLAGLHALGGLGYGDILPYQLAVFTLLPVLVYLVGRELHSRAAGLLGAGLVVFRQHSGLLLGGEVTGTNLHMLMSDVQTAIGLVLFTYLVIRWLKRPRERRLLALGAGGVLGLTMLFRSEVVVALAAAGLPALLLWWKKPGRFLAGMGFMTAGVVLVISPWIGRNYLATGQIFLDKPGNRVDRLIDTFWKLPEQLEGRGFQEDENQNSAWKMLERRSSGSLVNPLQMISILDLEPGLAEKSPEQITTSMISRENLEPDLPDSVLDVLLHHLSNGLRQSVLYLPSYPLGLEFDFLSRILNNDLKTTYGGFFYPPETLIQLLPYWDINWDGRAVPRSLVFLGVSLGLILWGWRRIWERWSWIALVPVLVLLSYIGVYALITQSGGRWLIEGDWAVGLLYSAGLVEFLGVFLGRGEKKFDEISIKIGQEINAPARKRALPFLGAAAGLLLLGTVFPLAGVVLPGRSRAGTAADGPVLDDSLTGDEQAILKAFLDSGGAVFSGAALYPRYFEENQKDVDTMLKYYPGQTTFTLVGEEMDYIVWDSPGPPDRLPHGAEVVVVGCPGARFSDLEGMICLGCYGGGIDALAVIIRDQQGGDFWEVLWREGDPGPVTGCPLP